MDNHLERVRNITARLERMERAADNLIDAARIMENFTNLSDEARDDRVVEMRIHCTGIGDQTYFMSGKDLNALAALSTSMHMSLSYLKGRTEQEWEGLQYATSKAVEDYC